MLNKIKKSILINLLLLIALISIGLYIAEQTPSANAGTNDFLMTWSSNSYIPPQYAGKALPTIGTTVEIVVLPVKKLSQDADAFTYLWVLDGKQAYSSQGKGKSSFQFQITKWDGDKHEVEARVLDAQENMLWRGFLTIKVRQPQILFNTPNNNYAVSESMSVNTGKELTIYAIPLFFRANKISDLVFNWQLNEQTLTPALGEQNPDKLIIKVPAGTLSGSVFKNLSLSIQNPLDALQQISAGLNIEIKQ
ncbi:MAG TPA: hypothetical protein P5089_03965 [Candidatus Portnoybacteria bacterium]|nr:hypothetical protein [Candidatus Portnoybacteria bacterium]